MFLRIVHVRIYPGPLPCLNFIQLADSIWSDVGRKLLDLVQQKVLRTNHVQGTVADPGLPGPGARFSAASRTGVWVRQAGMELGGSPTAHGPSGKRDELLLGESISGKDFTLRWALTEG